MLTFLVVGVVFLAAGALIGRSWVLVVAACLWPLFFIGLHADWWGSGVGESWAVALVLLILTSVAGAMVGLLARRRLGLGRFAARAWGRRVG